MIKVSTSILSSNDKIDTTKKLNNTNTDFLHYDIMDGKFVPNKAFSFKEVNQINKASNKNSDIHLMVINPLKYLHKLKKLNISYLTFHIELDKDIDKIIKKIKKSSIKVGLAINPDTPINKLLPYLDKIDLVLVMSVVPGKGGQLFIENSLNKIKELNEIKLNKHYNYLISVDGGVNDKNIDKIILSKADMVVVGSYITNSLNYQEKISKLKED